MRVDRPVAALLCCARTELSTEQRARLSRIAGPDLDVRALAALAEAHGVTPLLARHLDLLGAACTHELRAEIAAAAKLHAARSLARAAELVRLVATLREAGAPALAIKGPVSALLCYGELGLRTFGDLDVLVCPEDAGCALDALGAHGYVPHLPLSAWARERVIAVDNELLLRHREDGRLVDLHWALLARGYSFSPDGVGPFAQRAEVDVAGTALPTIGLEATLLFLLLHGAKHDWASLGWLCDVAELVQRHPLDWDAVLAWSSAAGRRRLIDVGLALAVRLLDAQVPEPALQRGRADAQVAAAVAELARRMFSPPPRSLQAATFGLVYFALMERAADRARFFHDVVLRPTAHEWRALPLPPSLSPLYYALRPLRLSWKYARAGWRH